MKRTKQTKKKYTNQSQDNIFEIRSYINVWNVEGNYFIASDNNNDIDVTFMYSHACVLVAHLTILSLLEKTHHCVLFYLYFL